MSIAITIADKMAKRINSSSRIGGVSALVYEPKKLQSEIATLVAKKSGAAVAILYQGRKLNTEGLPVTRRYTVSIFGLPTFQAAAGPTTQDIDEEVYGILNDWEPDMVHDALFREIRVLSSDMRLDNQYLIYDQEVEVDCTR